MKKSIGKWEGNFRSLSDWSGKMHGHVFLLFARLSDFEEHYNSYLGGVFYWVASWDVETHGHESLLPLPN